MATSERLAFPFRLVQADEETQRKYAEEFLGFPNGIVTCNHWGFKMSATVTQQELEDLYNYPLDPSDIWVVTPPKCGTTWIQEMVWLIANNLDYEGAKTPLMPDRWSYIDFGAMMDTQHLASLGPPPGDGGRQPLTAVMGDPNRPPPRFIKSHLPLCMSSPRLLDTCKVVYVARNPKDVCVSFYHHCRMFRSHDFTGDLQGFVDKFMDCSMAETPTVEHMIEAWNLRHHPNMCFLFFEDMKHDLKSQIRKVAKFLGKSYSEEQVDTLASHLHIDNFKKNVFVNREELKDKGFLFRDRGNFIRKGKTGDWKNHFSPEMNEAFDKWLAHKLRCSDLTFTMQLDKQD